MSNSKLSFLLVAFIVVIPLVYLAAIYNTLPQTVAVHFGMEGKPDKFGSKATLLVSSIVLSVVGFGIYLLLSNIHKVDPKRTAKYSAGSMKKVGFAIAIFMAALNIAFTIAAVETKLHVDKILFPLVGLLFAYLGNVMYSVKPNYFFGMRTPWALENEDNWRKTHQLAGKLWFLGGIMFVLISLLFAASFVFIAFVSIIVIITFIPLVYSYTIYKQQQRSLESNPQQ